MPFVTAPPCAIVLGPRLLPAPDWFRSAYLEATRSADLDLADALRTYDRYGTDLWAAADESVRSGIDGVLSVLRGDAGAEGDAGSEHDEAWLRPGTEASDLPSDESFAAWWPIVTGEPMIRATLTSFPHSWNGPGPMVPDFAPVELGDMHAWMRLFVDAWELRVEPGSEVREW